MQSLRHTIIACSCGSEHLHCLAELPADKDEVSWEIGRCKQKVSHSLRDQLPGSIWSAGGEFKLIRDTEQLHNTFRYIRAQQEAGTVVWSHRGEEDWIGDPSLGHWKVNEQRVLVRVAATQD